MATPRHQVNYDDTRSRNAWYFSLLPTTAMQFHSRDLMLILGLYYTAFSTALVTQCRMVRLLGIMWRETTVACTNVISQHSFVIIANTGPADETEDHENLCSDLNPRPLEYGASVMVVLQTHLVCSSGAAGKIK